jgi:hypothetical protein
MNVKSLEQMETIVSKNKDLSWDGWTVVHTYKSEKGSTSNRGRFIDGKWNIQTLFVPNNTGWEIPDKYVR